MLFEDTFEKSALVDRYRCYLFTTNYARMKPDIAGKALPYLLQDMEDTNPLIRGLALRTMSYVHVEVFVQACAPDVGQG